MHAPQKVLFVDVSSGYYRIERYPIESFWGPVDLGLHLSAKHGSLNMGVGLLSGSIFPGSSRLVFTGFSPCWGGFYVSSMGGAGMALENLGVNMVSLVGKAGSPSMLVLNRTHGEDVEVGLHPADPGVLWSQGRGGVYGAMEHAMERFGDRFEEDPRVIAAGPASASTDFGALASAPMKKGKTTFADTWAGRGGFGSKMLQEHNVVAVMAGGTHIDEDFRNRTVADGWFEARFKQKLAAKDFDATAKYRFDPRLETGGTFGVNFASLKGRLLSFNYRSMFWDEEERLRVHREFVEGRYLRQFKEASAAPGTSRTCGEPCAAVCKKVHGEHKKDYEPYEALGPQCGVFDQRAAERLVGAADRLGFDAISAGGVLSWLFECMSSGLLKPEEAGASAKPAFAAAGFDPDGDSARNAAIGVEVLEAAASGSGPLDFSGGARKLARRIARDRGRQVMDAFVYASFDRGGWMVPNQYWTPGALSPMPVAGKYYMFYGPEFMPPVELGRACADRFARELVLDNAGICRFHRAWAEEMVPEIYGSLFGGREAFLESVRMTAMRIASRNASLMWETRRNADFVRTFLSRRRDVEGDRHPDLDRWIGAFESDPDGAAWDFWYGMHRGAQQSLREF